jgi:uncharacterized membrane protein (DUF485 family)
MSAASSKPAAGAAHDDHPELSRRNARAGLVLFFLYLAFYAGFMGLAAFAPDLMGRPALAGVNLAITYGMGLIVGAFVIAVWYMVICGRNARLVCGPLAPQAEDPRRRQAFEDNSARGASGPQDDAREERRP